MSPGTWDPFPLKAVFTVEKGRKLLLEDQEIVSQFCVRPEMSSLSQWFGMGSKLWSLPGNALRHSSHKLRADKTLLNVYPPGTNTLSHPVCQETWSAWFDLGVLQTKIVGSWWWVVHYMFRRFVSEPYWTSMMYPPLQCSKQIWECLSKSGWSLWHDVSLCSFCSSVSLCGMNWAQIFLFCTSSCRIWRNVSLFMINSCGFILRVSRLSLVAISETFGTACAVREVELHGPSRRSYAGLLTFEAFKCTATTEGLIVVHSLQCSWLPMGVLSSFSQHLIFSRCWMAAVKHKAQWTPTPELSLTGLADPAMSW
jgi:hypothetical protein